MTPKQLLHAVAVKVYNFVKPLLTTDISMNEDSKIVQSYSQSAEDLIVDAILMCKPVGVYVDIGANNPNDLNNTKRFYDRGWSGINIEPNPKEFQELLQYRKRDINLNCGVSDIEGSFPFYVLDENMVSTFNKSVAIQMDIERGNKIVHIINLPVLRLDTMLDNDLDGRHIDFMSIDVEGNEVNVLRSNNWVKYRPKVIIIETCYNPGEILSVLLEQQYQLVYRNATNGIFVDMKLNEGL
jgi:FkbM family methyltransferase